MLNRKKIHFTLALVLAACLWLIGAGRAGAANVTQFAPNPIVFDQSATNDNLVVLMAAASEHDSALTLIYSGASFYPKHFWYNNWTSTNLYMKWRVALATGGVYRVYAKLSADAVTPLRLSVTNTANVLDFNTRSIGWDKLDCGLINIPAGTNQLLLQKTSNANTLSIISLELIRESDRPAYEARVASFRSDPTWFSESKYGLMTQFGAWGFPPNGSQASIHDFANGFDVPKFVNLVTNTGSKYVIWSLTWWSYQMLAPIQSVKNLVPGNTNRTTQRDVVGELATALKAAGVRFMLYYHCGQDEHLGYNTTDFWQAQQYPAADHTSRGTGDRQTYFTNWINIITEIGNRYGTNLDGWFFDDGSQVYYPAPFERLGKAAKAGNPNRLISYNTWIAASATDFADVYFGENSHGEVQPGSAPAGGNGIFTDGPHKGVLQQGMFTMEQDWGIHQASQPITTQITANQAIAWVQSASARRVPVSFNLMLWADQTYALSSVNVLLQLKNAIYNQANLVVNGGFESPVLAAGAYAGYAAGATDISGWTVDASPADGVQLFAPALVVNNGSQTLQLTGAGETYAAGGGVSQTIATVPGRTYAVSVDVVSRHGSAVSGSFNFGGSNYTLNASSQTFTTLTWLATATSSNTLIDIKGYTNSAAQQLIVDNVSVVAVGAPSIIIAPQGRTNYAGAFASLSVVADGSSPLSYQWYVNTSTVLAGATNAAFVLNSVQTNNSGIYSVVVSNSFGAVTSAPVRLLVKPNLAQNGSFEQPQISGYNSYAPGANNLLGWSVETTPADGVQLFSTGLVLNNGSQNLQLSGGSAYNQGGKISQTIATTPGWHYVVSLDVASRYGNTVKGVISFGNHTNNLQTSSQSFSTATQILRATAATTPLAVTGFTNSVLDQLIIDDVVVAPVAPFEQWQLTYFGSTSSPQAQPDADPLNKGMANYAQFLAGLNPTNAASLLAITQVTRQGTDLRLTWKTAGPRTNILQVSTNCIDFTDLPASYTAISQVGDVTTNYTDQSILNADHTTRFYRVRVLQL